MKGMVRDGKKGGIKSSTKGWAVIEGNALDAV